MSSIIRDRAASTPEMLAAFGDDALVAAALRFEAMLAKAQADLGLIPDEAAAAIEAACAQPIAVRELAEAAAHAGTLAIPLVDILRQRTPGFADLVHKGATSHDLADTALMLQAKAGGALLARDAAPTLEALRTLTVAHAETPMTGRTLLQAALPITFGLKSAGWLAGLSGAWTRVDGELGCLRLQFGGASGALHGLDGRAAALSDRLAQRLGLAAPVLPWHSDRQEIAGLAAALAILGGVLGKIARDIALLTQSEIGEVMEPQIAGRGGSSAMTHKRNPTGCQVALSAAIRAPQLAAGIMAGLPQEHERGLGGWQAEGPALAQLFEIVHGALAAMRVVIEGLDVRADRMAANLAAAGIGADVGEAPALAARALQHYRD